MKKMFVLGLAALVMGIYLAAMSPLIGGPVPQGMSDFEIECQVLGAMFR